MLNCPFCSADLSEAVVLARRCPVCGCQVESDDGTDTGPGIAPRPAAAADSGSSTDDSDSIEALRATLAQVVRQGEDSAAEAAPPGVAFDAPASAGHAASTPSSPAGKKSDATLALPGGEAEVDLSKVTAMWQGMVTPRKNPLMTIKAASREAAAQSKSSVVVKSRAIRRQYEIDAESADYEILELIGEGGMGVVYAARQGSVDRTVAIKMLNAEIAENLDQQQKFLSEAVVTGDLDHPNIVPIYDLGSNEEGALFYSMKRVVGTPWDAVMGQKSLPENLEILLKVADAVAFAHSRGVIHRDLKPENVMLGGFGEVLVMDWGLAMSISGFRASGSITQSGSMGGTPAYMAPEMATGPIEKVGPPSDVYLLGAILYEIVNGQPPHHGSNVMDCLHAAARNEIVPSSHSGELADIARQAMATDVRARFANVLEFQAAIRQYESHAESIVLSRRAEQDLARARRDDDYEMYSRAMFAYQESLALWEGNDRARDGISTVKLAYAESALKKADYDLGVSLLDGADPAHVPLRKRLLAAARERDARQQRLNQVRRTAIGLAAAIFLIVTAAFVGSTALYLRAEELAGQRDKAYRDVSEKNDLLQIQTAAALTAKQTAQDNELEAMFQAYVAEQAQQQEKIATQEQQYEAYIARIGLSAAKIEENASQFAVQLLTQCEPKLRRWEWGRLMHLADQQHERFEAASRVETVAFDATAVKFATGGWGGFVQVWNAETGDAAWQFHHGQHVFAVSFSPDGRLLATAGRDDDGAEVKIWNLADRQLHCELSGHGDNGQPGTVYSAVFSVDGRRLLTASADGTARLWNADTGAEIRKFHGHTAPVYCAAFSPDENRIVTASEDRSVMIWPTDESASWPPPTFTGHTAAVYAAAFSPDGKYVASGGADRTVLIWNSDDVRPVDFDALAATQSTPPTPAFARLAGHTADVRCVAFSDDRSHLVTAGHDNTIKIWATGAIAEQVANAHELTPVKTLRGHTGWVRACDYSPDGALVLSGGYDGQVKIWRTDAYEEFRVLGKPGPVAVLGATFSDEGSHVVTAYQDGAAKTWNVATGLPVQELVEGHDFLSEVAIFFPDGRRIATGARDGTVRIWDVESGTQSVRLSGTGRTAQNVLLAISADAQHVLTGSDEPSPEALGDQRTLAQLWDWSSATVRMRISGVAPEVSAVAFLENDKTLLTAHIDGHCRLYDATDGHLTGRLTGHTRKVTAVRYLSGRRRLLTASEDHTVAQWDLAERAEITSLVMRHQAAVTAMDVTTDGRLAVTGCADGSVRLWDVDSAQVVAGPFAVDGTLSGVAVDGDGRRALTVSYESSGRGDERYAVRLWDLPAGREITSGGAPDAARPFKQFAARDALLWSAVFSPDGDCVLTVGGKHARLWSIATGEQLRSFSPHGAVTFASFSKSAEQVVTGSRDNSAKIWQSAQEEVVAREGALRKLEGVHRGDVNSAQFSPSRETILTAGNDGRAVLWNIADGRKLREFAGHGGPVRFATFTADGRKILTVSDDATGRIWDVEDAGQPLLELIGHELAVLCGAFSADGTLVVTGGDDNTARVWNIADGDLVHTLEGHTAAVTSVSFSPDAGRVITGSRDRTAKIWELINRKEVLTLKAHTGEVTSSAFSPDGRTVLTASRDGTAILWLTAAEGWQPIGSPRQGELPNTVEDPVAVTFRP